MEYLWLNHKVCVYTACTTIKFITVEIISRRKFSCNMTNMKQMEMIDFIIGQHPRVEMTNRCHFRFEFRVFIYT